MLDTQALESHQEERASKETADAVARVLVDARAECYVLTFGAGACMRMLDAEVHVGGHTRLR